MKKFYHEYKGFGRVPSRCEVRIIEDSVLGNLICFVNLGEGTSVTNASEQLATEIVNKFAYDPENCRFFETYTEYGYDTFDEIEYTWEEKNNNPYVAKKPLWKLGADNFKWTFITNNDVP